MHILKDIFLNKNYRDNDMTLALDNFVGDSSSIGYWTKFNSMFSTMKMKHSTLF